MPPTAHSPGTTPLGMGRFDDVVSEDDAHALEAYILDEAWKQFKTDSAPK